MDSAQHFDRLFETLVREYGALDDDTLSAIVGFGAGGPVSLCTVRKRNLFVTCELSLYPEQKRSAEGLKYELMYVSGNGEDEARRLLTALGNLSMNARLGDGHTVDISGALPEASFQIARLTLFSRAGRFWRRNGVYQVHPVWRS